MDDCDERAIVVLARQQFCFRELAYVLPFSEHNIDGVAFARILKCDNLAGELNAKVARKRVETFEESLGFRTFQALEKFNPVENDFRDLRITGRIWR